MTLLVLLFKISVPPVLVAMMTLAARRWGPTIGGLIMGLPWMTGPVLFFLGIEKGTDFLVSAARGTELAVWGMGAYILAFGLASARFNWPGALLAAIAGYIAVGLVTQGTDLPLWLATAVALAVLVFVRYLLPQPRSIAMPGSPPAWDIPARMAATFVLVSVIMVSADLLGPQRSGLIASYPVILTVIGVFTLRQWGRDALLRVLSGISLSLITFVGFFAIVGYAAPKLGLVPSFVLAAVVAIAISGLLILFNRRSKSAISGAR